MTHCQNAGWPLLAALALLPLPAQAQEEDYQSIVTIMRACAEIDDMVARVTCYDNNIAPRGGTPAGAQGAPARPAIPARPAPEFGGENLPREREAQRREQVDEIRRNVTLSDEVEPGIYLLTLDDGSQWRFTESMGLSYDPPSAGSQIRIERGALGSYRLRFAGQRAVRVQRTR